MAAICVSYVWQILFSQREGHGPNPRLPTKMRVWRDFQDVKDRSKGRLPVGGDSHGEGKVTRVFENSCGAATTLRLALQRDGVGEPAPRGRNYTAEPHGGPLYPAGQVRWAHIHPFPVTWTQIHFSGPPKIRDGGHADLLVFVQIAHSPTERWPLL